MLKCHAKCKAQKPELNQHLAPNHVGPSYHHLLTYNWGEASYRQTTGLTILEQSGSL